VRPIGGLGNGSVRPAFRGRGLQKALIAHRIRDGWDRGYRAFFGETENPVSAHNMESLGWRKLFDEQDWELRRSPKCRAGCQVARQGPRTPLKPSIPSLC